MSELTHMVRLFNEKYGRPSRNEPTSELPADEISMVMRKLGEEIAELRRALEDSDIEHIADGLADAVYVLAGMSDQFGLDLDLLLQIVHDSNMTKELYDGDAIKGPGYRAPDIPWALQEMRKRSSSLE